MAASPWRIFSSAKEFLGEAVIDLENHSFVCALLTSAWTPDLDADEVLADIDANEVAGNGYARQPLTTTWDKVGGVTTFHSDSPIFSAVGGDIVSRYAVIFDDTQATPSNPLLAYCELDIGNDWTIPDGTSTQIIVGASGVFDLSGGIA